MAPAIAASDDDWFDVATLKEPYRIEGKKTMGFEIAEQLGWRMPDVIVYPTGGGVGLIGIHKALRELRRARLGHRRPLPRLVVGAVDRLRADRARLRGRRDASPSRGRTRRPSRSASTCPRRWATSWCSTRSRATGGTAVAVDDDDLLADLRARRPARGDVPLPRGRGDA